MGDTKMDIEKLWQAVDEKVKEGDINLSLWEAIEKAVPVTLDEGRMVLGFEPKNMSYAGNLRSGPNEALLRGALDDIIGERPEIVVIEGTTQEAWENYKQRRIESEEATAHARRFDLHHGETQAGWKALNKQMRSLYEESQTRGKPVEEARFLVRAIPKIAAGEARLMEEDPDAEELHDTQLNRLFDRMSGYTGIPAPLIALEYLRYRGSKKKG